ncbi:hypothetical protein BC827DRAFT_654119 [Russula dissimulans]|nr:hypothetical protein BC827DRAFT_654119 [Russula dissimulans]
MARRVVQHTLRPRVSGRPHPFTHTLYRALDESTHSSNIMSVNPSPELNSLFQAALDEFEKKSGINLIQHQVFTKLMTCQSVVSVVDVLHEQTTAFQSSRGDDYGKLMKWIKRIVDILHTLSTNNVLVGGVGMAFPPAKAVCSGIAVLLSRIKDVSASYDALLDLFESFESFLGRLDTYTKIPLTTAMTEIAVKILIELLSTISLAIQHVKQGRLKARTSATETLEVVYGLVKNMKVVMDDGRLLMNDIHRALVNLQQLASEINKRTRDELQEKVRRWLSPPNPSINHNSARKAYREGSAEWFLHGNTFPEWKTTIGSLLWISGKPGSGKTILSSPRSLKTSKDHTRLD